MNSKQTKYPDLSLPRYLAEGARRHPDKRFVVSGGQELTYSQALEQAIAIAGYFQDVAHLGPQSTIGICASNLAIVPSILAAAQLVGVRIAMFSERVGELEFASELALVKPQIVITTSPSRRDEIDRILPGAPVIGLGGDVAGTPSLEELAADQGHGDAMAFPNANADAQIVVFSSGSTGAPKAIVNRASSFALNGNALCKWLELGPEDVLYLPVPLIHVFGLVGVYATLVADATFVTAPKYNVHEACAIIEREGVTVHLGVPTNFIRELRANEAGTWDFSSLRAGLIGGADCPAFVIESFEKLYGCRLMQSYGMSETAATLTVTPLEYDWKKRSSTLGFCIDGASMKIDPSNGEVLCKSASLSEGVLQEDGSVVLDLDDGWLRTGDVGAIDGAGMPSITGRLKNVIVRGGINVFPSEIELYFDGLADVAECCALGVSDPDLGQRICVAVILKDGAAVSADELHAGAIAQIGKGKAPDYVLLMKSLPLLENGKIDRKALEAECERRITA